jgi:hypothetical protein
MGKAAALQLGGSSFGFRLVADARDEEPGENREHEKGNH